MDIVLLLHKILAVIIPIKLAKEKLIMVSYKVTQICVNKLFSLNRSKIVRNICDGYDVKNGFSISFLAHISHRRRNVTNMNILKKRIIIFCF